MLSQRASTPLLYKLSSSKHIDLSSLIRITRLDERSIHTELTHLRLRIYFYTCVHVESD